MFRQRNDFGIDQRPLGADRLNAELMKLAESPCLRPIILSLLFIIVLLKIGLSKTGQRQSRMKKQQPFRAPDLKTNLSRLVILKFKKILKIQTGTT